MIVHEGDRIRAEASLVGGEDAEASRRRDDPETERHEGEVAVGRDVLPRGIHEREARGAALHLDRMEHDAGAAGRVRAGAAEDVLPVSAVEYLHVLVHDRRAERRSERVNTSAGAGSVQIVGPGLPPSGTGVPMRRACPVSPASAGPPRRPRRLRPLFTRVVLGEPGRCRRASADALPQATSRHVTATTPALFATIAPTRRVHARARGETVHRYQVAHRPKDQSRPRPPAPIRRQPSGLRCDDPAVVRDTRGRGARRQRLPRNRRRAPSFSGPWMAASCPVLPDPPPSDQACLDGVRRGDAAAAEVLVRRFEPQVRRLVRAHRPRAVPEDDLVQEVFLAVFTRLDRYRERDGIPFEHWLSRLTINLCRDALRSERRRRPRPRSRRRGCSGSARWSRTRRHRPTSARGAGGGGGAPAQLPRTTGSSSRCSRWRSARWRRSPRSPAESHVLKVRAFRARRRLQHAARRLLSTGSSDE